MRIFLLYIFVIVKAVQLHLTPPNIAFNSADLDGRFAYLCAHFAKVRIE